MCWTGAYGGETHLTPSDRLLTVSLCLFHFRTHRFFFFSTSSTTPRRTLEIISMHAQDASPSGIMVHPCIAKDGWSISLDKEMSRDLFSGVYELSGLWPAVPPPVGSILTTALQSPPKAPQKLAVRGSLNPVAKKLICTSVSKMGHRGMHPFTHNGLNESTKSK